MCGQQWSGQGSKRGLRARAGGGRSLKREKQVEEENVEREEQEEEQRTTEDLLTLRRFQALAGEWTSEELGRCFWLTPKPRHASLTNLGNHDDGKNHFIEEQLGSQSQFALFDICHRHCRDL
jgi:hypothetical protein